MSCLLSFFSPFNLAEIGPVACTAAPSPTAMLTKLVATAKENQLYSAHLYERLIHEYIYSVADFSTARRNDVETL